MYLSLGGRIYTSNNSYIDIDDIGAGDTSAALLCITDLLECCHARHTLDATYLGQWLYPNGTDVHKESDNYDFYRNRGPSIVRLYCRNSVRSPTGLYCCEVPDALNSQNRVCANVGMYLMYLILFIQGIEHFVYTVLEVPTTPELGSSTAPEIPSISTSGASCSSPAGELEWNLELSNINHVLHNTCT